jgi:uncharacterized protein YdaU (DUF1376 family)
MTKAPAFQFYASDFVDDTMEWTPLEVGIYMRLLCFQWINKSLPQEKNRMARLSGCTEKEFSDAWETIKSKFYVNGDGRIYNKKLENIRIAQDEYREKQRISGVKGARVRYGDPISDPNGEKVALQSSSSSSSLSSSSEKEGVLHEGGKMPSCHPRKLFEIYANENKKLPRAETFTKEREHKCRVRLNAKNFIENFKKAVQKSQDTPFLCGENARGWRADFDWLIANDTNIIKILEGRYTKGKTQEKTLDELKAEWKKRDAEAKNDKR